jgi:hypothetical protein
VLRIERGVLYEIELSRGLLGAATLDARNARRWRRSCMTA